MNSQEREVSEIGLLIKIILPICLIVMGVAGWHYFKSKETKMKRKPPKKQSIAVETISMKPGNYQTSIRVMGTVMPDRKITLKSKIAGEVISTSLKFKEGGVMKKGEILLELDDSDYKLDVQKAQSALDKALSALAIEKGSQLIAKEELKLINEALEEELKATNLALRTPQLIQAKATVDNARADLKKAQLNISRTKIIIPFNALVLEKHVDSGSLVTAQGPIATLVDVDNYKVEAQMPPDRLNSLIIDKTKGSIAIINSQYSDQSWKGKVIRTTGKMSEKSRMIGVIISVPDPLGLKLDLNNQKITQQLFIDDHVDVKIMGKTLENVFSISRSILRDGDTLWIYNSGVLEIKKVILAWKEDSVVYIKSGISSGTKVITSDLPAAVNGMKLRLSSGDGS